MCVLLKTIPKLPRRINTTLEENVTPETHADAVEQAGVLKRCFLSVPTALLWLQILDCKYSSTRPALDVCVISPHSEIAAEILELIFSLT